MKVEYNDEVYKVLEEKNDRVYMKNVDTGKEKDIAKSTFQKANVISAGEKEDLEELTEEQKRIKELEAQLAEATKEKPKKKKKKTPWIEQKVTFKAFKDDDKYSDDIIVTINGKNWQIQRGKYVEIPRFVYLALEDHERQKAVAANTTQKFNNQYKKKESRL